MKLYIDLTFTKISGQYMMQKALRDACIEKGIYATKEDCDVAVYVQVPFEGSYEEFKDLKAKGKKIVFIHHYFTNFEHFAIFTVPNLLELVDLNICIAEDSELYKYLVKRGCKPIVYEQVAVDRLMLCNKYWKNFDKKEKSICFVGRANKGLDDFLNYINSTAEFYDYKIGIFCATEDTAVASEALKLNSKDNYNVYVNLSEEALWELMSDYQFIYMNADMMAGKNHLETIMHEAMSMGVIVVLGENQRRYITAPDTLTGFLMPDFYKHRLNKFGYFIKQETQYNYLRDNFIDKAAMMEKNINTITNYFK